MQTQLIDTPATSPSEGLLSPDPVFDPTSDGKPLAETGVHLDEIVRLIAILRRRYAAQPDVHVGGDLLLYWAEGDPSACVAPDVFVAPGVPRKPPLRSYKLWEQGVPPSVVSEVTSHATRRDDRGRERAPCRQLGAPENFIDAPLGAWARPGLRGYQLRAGRFVRLRPRRDGSLPSRELRLRLRLVDGLLQLFDVATGERLKSDLQHPRAGTPVGAKLSELGTCGGEDQRSSSGAGDEVLDGGAVGPREPVVGVDGARDPVER